MLLFFEWLVSYLIIVCGKLYAYLCPPPKDEPSKGDHDN